METLALVPSRVSFFASRLHQLSLLRLLFVILLHGSPLAVGWSVGRSVDWLKAYDPMNGNIAKI